jgi:hypothetical protein
MTEQFQLCELGSCRLGKLHRCSEIMGCTWLPNLSTYSFAVIRPWRVIMGQTKYCIAILLPKLPQNLPLVSLQAFWIVSFLGCSPNVNSSWCREEREGRLIWPYHACVSSCLLSRFFGGDTIVYASEHYIQ